MPSRGRITKQGDLLYKLYEAAVFQLFQPLTAPPALLAGVLTGCVPHHAHHADSAAIISLLLCTGNEWEQVLCYYLATSQKMDVLCTSTYVNIANNLNAGFY